VIEPTCGKGAFLVAAHAEWGAAALAGYDINPDYVADARSILPSSARVVAADFFATDWAAELRDCAEPLLVIGNPPWVTSSELGALKSKNLPRKANLKNLAGLDALTGKSNFDVSEWMLTRLLQALEGRQFVLSLLCKSVVARRVMEYAATTNLGIFGELRAIDAMAHFGAAVDAVLLTVVSPSLANRWGEPCRSDPCRWPRYAGLEETVPSSVLGYVDGIAILDVEAWLTTRWLAGTCVPEWRSGLKHDCSAVMEFVADGVTLTSRSGGTVELEPDLVFPMMKGSDVANARWPPSRAMLVTQRRLGQETASIRGVAPNTWRYLQAHREALAARKSSIYAGQPEFAMFGIGDYAFAPWKVAIAGLYKKLAFVLVGPHEGRPVVFDDTTYFLPFDSEQSARLAHEALTSSLSADFLHARIFWDDKRPINKRVLQGLDLSALQRSLRGPSGG
jgi:hypothetical protein